MQPIYVSIFFVIFRILYSHKWTGFWLPIKPCMGKLQHKKSIEKEHEEQEVPHQGEENFCYGIFRL